MEHPLLGWGLIGLKGQWESLEGLSKGNEPSDGHQSSPTVGGEGWWELQGEVRVVAMVWGEGGRGLVDPG